ncbi:MAG: ROK family protein, partial [Ruthenibacterium sp.]
TRAAMEADKASLMWTLCNGKAEKANGETAFQAMRRADKTAAQVIETYLKYLCVGINSIVNIFQPDVLCIGGGVSHEDETLLQPIRQFLAQYGYARYSTCQTRVTQAKLGNDAGIIGAALIENYF